jgi:hypothetical protein
MCIQLINAESVIFLNSIHFYKYFFYKTPFIIGGTRWVSWLRHCATSRNVASSVPDGVTGTFHWQNPSDLTMALGLTRPPTEMSVRNNNFWGWRRPVRRVDNPTTFVCWLSWNLGFSASWKLISLYRPVMGLLYLHLLILPSQFSDFT